MPTISGFLAFIRDVMGIDDTILADDAPVIAMAFRLAMNTVNQNIALISCELYAIAVYNLAGDRLMNYAPGAFFVAYRQEQDILDFTPGVINGSSDQSTSQSISVPDSLSNLTLMDLQNIKTPWGREYLAIAQDYGTLWGLT
ncbi:hypothetical protein [Martelella alba]|uniref:Uncharacterized protein n=1 Tax=Martelella alba TaxID=2590451 RepID=A0ABY2SE99_9HYPH|nr:hypothetical protein [Martelella alba]TKI02736.1 hypothetical protein FCN80_24140 [Martelella alba]